MKSGMAQMTKGGLIMDVMNVEQAKIAEEAGVNKDIDCKLYLLRVYFLSHLFCE